MRNVLYRLTGVALVLCALSACSDNDSTIINAVVNLEQEPAGKNCPTGGTAIQAGHDTNHNSKLDASEVESTAYSCNGADGAEGPAGASKDGKSGTDGHSALVVTTPEAAGKTCPAGGQRIEQGIDANDDGKLSDDEIVATATVCSGVAGEAGNDGSNALVNVTTEASGANCATGGQKLESGIDTNGDGTLAGAEISKTGYFCNGSNGVAALNGLSKVSSETAGANCGNGGIRLDMGLDDDQDGTLEAAEIDVTNYLCNGADGAHGTTSLVAVVDEPAGASCVSGGEKVTYGLDSNANNTLDAGEVTGTRYVCDGAAGAQGINALVKVTAVSPGAICAIGGQEIDSGRDTDASGVLDASEVQNTTYVCNGSP